jgi:hypothetical protein
METSILNIFTQNFDNLTFFTYNTHTMGERFNLNDISTTPEFETRCDMFVAEVELVIAPKYIKEFIIFSENTTKGNVTPSIIKRIIIDRDGIDFWNWYENKNTLKNRLKDIESLTQNTAYISIFGNDKNSVPKMKKFIEEVFECSKKYRGIFEPDNYGENADDEKDRLIEFNDDKPSSHLWFIFKNS